VHDVKTSKAQDAAEREKSRTERGRRARGAVNVLGVYQKRRGGAERQSVGQAVEFLAKGAVPPMLRATLPSM
jgi:hypothetical protein